MRRLIIGAALAAVGFSSSCGVAGERPEGFERRSFHVDPQLKFRDVPLNEIIRNPQQDAVVRFDAMMNRRDESIWQQYYTPFKPGDYKSFSVWPADAAVWEARGRGRSIATLYLAGDSPEMSELYSIDRYTPVRISGVVRSTFDSRPWIQVYFVEPMSSAWFSDESLGFLIRGLEGAQAGAGGAMDMLEEALDGPISPAGAAAAWKAMGWVNLSRKKYSDAEHCYTEALNAMPGDRQAVDGLARARRKAAPGSFSDEAASKDDPAPTADWKAMYTALFTEHEQNCKALAEAHSKCAEMAATLTEERDAAAKAHAECAGLKKQIEEKDAQIKTATEERDAALKAGAEGAAGAEGLKKMMEEKDAAVKTANEKVAALETERDELKKKVEAGGADAEASKKAMEEKDAAIKAANEKVTALEAERDELKKSGGDIKAANEKIAQLEAERDELKKRAEAGGDPEGLKKELEAQKSKTADLEQQVKDRDDTIKKQREEIDKLTEELKKKDGN
jgi:hypothetical protein